MSDRRATPLAAPAPGTNGARHVSIETLRLDLVGHDAAFGQRIAGAVAERLARSLPAVSAAEIGGLELRVELPQRASEAAVVEAVTSAISRALARTGGRSG